jgi:hypothetical protein
MVFAFYQKSFPQLDTFGDDRVNIPSDYDFQSMQGRLFRMPGKQIPQANATVIKMTHMLYH